MANGKYTIIYFKIKMINNKNDELNLINWYIYFVTFMYEINIILI